MISDNLVTNPFGFGEQLILELLKSGESVYTIFPSPKDVPMSFLGKINLKYCFLRFDQDADLAKILPKKVTNVYHIYEIYNGPFFKVFKSNTSATMLLLDWSRKIGVSKFVFLSSGEVYGQGQNLNEYSAYSPRSFYATTKFEAEYLFRYYNKSFDIATVRVFFPFGKHLDQGYIFDIYQSIKNKGSVQTEYGIIAPTYIDDIVEPLLKLRKVKNNQIFNICGSPVQVEVLVDDIKNACAGLPKKISIGNTELTGDNSKAKQELGYSETHLNQAITVSFGS